MKKIALNEGQSDAIREILRRSAAGLLAGGALRAGIEVLRQSNPRYDPPRAAAPAIVAIPRPVSEPPPPPFPAMSRLQMLPPGVRDDRNKTAGEGAWFDGIPGARWFYDKIPNVTSLQGAPDAQIGSDVPLMGAGIALGAGAGAIGGYHLTDKLLRAADRRRARKDLEEAQREYQEAAIGRAKALQFPKAAADMGVLVDGGTPADPAALRIKKALDRAYGASQILGSTVTLPPASPAPSTVSPTPPPPAAIGRISNSIKQPAPSTSVAPLPGVNGSGATEPVTDKSSAEGEQSQLAKTLTGFLYPGTLFGPAAANTNLALAGGALGLGGWLGYQHARDKDQAERTRKAIRDVDKANASLVPAPLIAQMVPTRM